MADDNGCDTTRSDDVVRHGPARRPDGTVEWSVWAPRAEAVELTWWDGDPATARRLAMTARGRGRFTATDVAPEGARYGFRLTPFGGEPGPLRPDPASRWQPDGPHSPSALFFPDSFDWTDRAWRGRPLDELVFYELHVGAFTDAGDFDAVVTRLDDLVDLGVTAIELMPVAQFPGDRNWGYDGVHSFAAQSTYGGPRALQRLVDACHRRRLCIFLDLVLNHLGPEGDYGGEFGPYRTNAYRTPWGDARNYDDRGSDVVRQFACQAVEYWLRDMHFDGLRLDAVDKIHDARPRHLLAELQDAADQVATNAKRIVHLVAESDANDVRLLDEPQRRGCGLAAQWSDDFHHSLHALLTGERQGYYLDFGEPEHLLRAFQATFVYDGRYSRFRDRAHGAPATGFDRRRFIVALQNHDQVGNRAAGDRIAELLDPPALQAAAAVLLLSPFTPLLFMGEEYGERRPFPYFCSFEDPALIEAVRRGRREEFPDQHAAATAPDPQAVDTFLSARLAWNWRTDPAGAALRDVYRRLLALRRDELLAGDPACTAEWRRDPTGAPNAGLLTIRRTRRGRPAEQIVAQINLSPRRAAAPGEPIATSPVASELLHRSNPAPTPDDSPLRPLEPNSPLSPYEVRVWALPTGEPFDALH